MTNDPTSAAVEAAARVICRMYLVATRPLATAEQIDAQVERGWTGWKSQASAALAAGLREIAAHPDMRLTVAPHWDEPIATRPHPTLLRIADAIAARGAGGSGDE